MWQGGLFDRHCGCKPSSSSWLEENDVALPDIRSITDFAALQFDEKHILARSAVVHRSEEVQLSVYILEPGGRIPAHRHTSSWDISVVMEGEIEIRFAKDAVLHTIRCKSQAINLVPLGAVHGISNPSTTRSAAFVLIQSRPKCFDFVEAALPPS
jgi:quercetin dioxygenase-like cupin family protein